jgi:predicted MFS family arabinose efflux permease
MRQVLSLSVYRRLLAAYGLTEIAWAVVSLALAVLVYRRTGSALGATAFFICAQFVPAFLSPALVARIDRLPPRRALSALYLLEAALFVFLAWVVGHLGVAFILAVALVDGVIALVVRSLARTATVGVTAPAGLLREGNALTNSVFSICLMAGPALGGVIVGIASVQAALLSASGIILLIALMLAVTQGFPAAVVDESPSEARLRAALRYARGQAIVRSLLALQAIGLVFFTMSIPVELVLAQRTLHAGAGGYGALLTTWGCGAIVGSVVFSRWRRRSAWALITLGAVALGAGFLIMAVSPTLVVAALGSVVAGSGNGVLPTAARTALQEHVSPQWMALMMSLNDSLWQAVPGLGILLGGAVAQLDGSRTALAVAGAGSLVIALAVAVLLRKALAQVVPPSAVADAPVAPLTFAAQREEPYGAAASK